VKTYFFGNSLISPIKKTLNFAKFRKKMPKIFGQIKKISGNRDNIWAVFVYLKMFLSPTAIFLCFAAASSDYCRVYTCRFDNQEPNEKLA